MSIYSEVKCIYGSVPFSLRHRKGLPLVVCRQETCHGNYPVVMRSLAGLAGLLCIFHFSLSLSFSLTGDNQHHWGLSLPPQHRETLELESHHPRERGHRKLPQLRQLRQLSVSDNIQVLKQKLLRALILQRQRQLNQVTSLQNLG